MNITEAPLAKRPAKSRAFYGWTIVGIAFTALLIRFGVLQTFGIFLVALVREFGWNRGAISLAQTIVMLMIGVGGPLVGFFLQRWGPRRVITISALLLGFVLALNSRITAIWHFYILWGVLGGLGHSFQSMLPWTAIVSNWFVRKRGLAIGIATAGIGVGYLFMAPFTQYVIAGYGWKAAFITLGGLLALGIAPMSAILVRERPQDMNLLPDGEGEPPARDAVGNKKENTQLPSREGEWTARRALKTPAFWFLSLSFAAILFTINMILAHQVAFLVDVGYKVSISALIFGIVGVTSVPFRIIWGSLSDRLGPMWTYTFSTLIILGGIFALLSIRSPSQIWLAYLYALLWGSSYGTTIIVIAVVSANIYQGRSFGVIFGFITLIGQVLGSPGAWLGGYLFDIRGNYNLAFTLALLSSALSCVLMWAVGIKKKDVTGTEARA